MEDGFLRAVERANPEVHAALGRALIKLRKALADPSQHSGLGLRKMHPSQVWELRLGLDLRALFLLNGSEVLSIFLGTHDEVQRFVRKYAD